MKRFVVALFAVLLPVGLFFVLRNPQLSKTQKEVIKETFQFDSVVLQFPESFPQGTRQLYEPMQKLRTWFSSLGSSIALADLDGDGVYQEYCHIHPSNGLLSVGRVPKVKEESFGIPVSFHGVHYEPSIMLPTRCLPWDINRDGHQDLLVSFFGRGPVALLQMHEWNFEPVDLLEDSGLGYMTVTMQVVDFDGDGVEEILLGDLFPRAFDLMDPHADFTYIEMPSSMGHSMNGGENRILKRISSINRSDFRFQELDWTKDSDQSRGWTMAMQAADLNGDLLPEIYFANTFGPDQLFSNLSTKDKIEFKLQRQGFGFHSTRSGRVGWDTFKAGGVDIIDYDRDGKQDIFVANLSGWFVPEGNFLFLNRATDFDWRMGSSDFENIARSVGLFGRGWPYDARFADFDSDGNYEMIQAYGLLGEDALVLRAFHEQYWVIPYLTRFHQTWPHLTPETVGKRRPNFGFYTPVDGYYHSVEEDLGLSSKDCRAVAVGDMDNDFDDDFLLSCMDGSVHVYWNQSPQKKAAIYIRFIRSSVNTGVVEGLRIPEREEIYALGASATVKIKGEAVQTGQFNRFGGGHTGTGTPDLKFLVSANSNAKVDVQYLDKGIVQSKSIELKPGAYTVFLEEERAQ